MGGGQQAKLRVRAAAWKNEVGRTEEGWVTKMRKGLRGGGLDVCASGEAGLKEQRQEVPSGTQETASSQAPRPSPSLVLGVEGAARLRRAQGVGPPVLPFPAQMQAEGAEGTGAEEVGAGRGWKTQSSGNSGSGGKHRVPWGRRQRIWIQALSLSHVPGQARGGAWLLNWVGTGWTHKDPMAWQGSLILCRQGRRGSIPCSELQLCWHVLLLSSMPSSLFLPG